MSNWRKQANFVMFDHGRLADFNESKSTVHDEPNLGCKG